MYKGIVPFESRSRGSAAIVHFSSARAPRIRAQIRILFFLFRVPEYSKRRKHCGRYSDALRKASCEGCSICFFFPSVYWLVVFVLVAKWHFRITGGPNGGREGSLDRGCDRRLGPRFTTLPWSRLRRNQGSVVGTGGNVDGPDLGFEEVLDCVCVFEGVVLFDTKSIQARVVFSVSTGDAKGQRHHRHPRTQIHPLTCLVIFVVVISGIV